MRNQSHSLHASSRACVFVYVLQSHRPKQSSAKVLPWTLLIHTQETSFKPGPAKVTLFQTEIKCEEGRAESSYAKLVELHSRSGTSELLCFALDLLYCDHLSSGANGKTFLLLLLRKTSPLVELGDRGWVAWRRLPAAGATVIITVLSESLVRTELAALLEPFRSS